jgi:hypothetical protein
MPPLVICNEPSAAFSTMAPNPRITRMAARSSLEDPGFLIILSPPAINAAAHARCIELLEAGAGIVPRTEDGETVICILIYLALEME